MKDWQRIRETRPDLTDYLIHWVRPIIKEGKYITPFVILIDIIESGYLKPTFATRSSIYDRSKRPTVKGPHPAVCFTEQSLDCFLKSCKALPTHYYPYGIALNKMALYQYGGRPVIYGSENILGTMILPSEPGYESGKELYKNGLPKDYQYLWMRYEPIPNADGYVVDWTHEREWRCRINTYHDAKLGNTPDEGIPLLLPAVYSYEQKESIYYLPKILVRGKDEKEIVEGMVKALSQEWKKSCQNSYLQRYFELLPKANIIALNELENDSDANKLNWIILGKSS